jgi:hypothetical protein
MDNKSVAVVDALDVRARSSLTPDEYGRLRTAMAEMLKEKHTLTDQIHE